VSVDNPPPAQRRAWWLTRPTPDVPSAPPAQSGWDESHGLLASLRGNRSLAPLAKQPFVSHLILPTARSSWPPALVSADWLENLILCGR
jgi:hypothetical protein